MASHTITAFGPASNPWTLSQEESARQAIASLRGYIYQLHASVAAWMRLPPDGELHLEVAEDYAQLLASPDKAEQILRAVQVKDTRESGSVTLNSADVLKAIETLFSLQESNKGRPVFLTFLTTSKIGRELKDPLPSGTPGLEVWSTGAKGSDAAELHDALRARFINGKLAEFLKSCSMEEFRGRLLTRLTFACGEPPWEQLEEDGRDYLVSIRSEVRAEPNAARRAYDVLFAALYRQALKPQARKLDRQAFLAAFWEATAVLIPSQQFIDLTDKALRSEAEAALSALPVTSSSLDFALLAEAARKLRDYGQPPTLLPLFPDVSSQVREALESLSDVERWVVSHTGTNTKHSARLRFSELLQQREFHHLVYAGPGAGKSHTLSCIATNLLGQVNAMDALAGTSVSDGAGLEAITNYGPDELIPLLLPLGGLKTADEVLVQIRTLLPDTNPEDVLRSPRICVLLDGWSEFATGEHFGQRAALLRSLAGVRVIACARHPDPSDTSFKCWTLERLAPEQIRVAVEQAFGSLGILSDDLADLLRLPLILSLYLLLGAATSAPGELIAHFHRHLSIHLPEQFEEALSDAVSLLSLARERSYNKFLAALRKAAAARKIAEPQSLLRQLGTITQRGSFTVSIHDLYWSWLSGVGLLRASRIDQAARQLDTRESLTLALQSGEFVEANVVAETANTDAALAATFDASLGRASMDSSLSVMLDPMFQHPYPAVRCRAAIAGIRSNRATYVGKGLDVIDEISAANLYVPDLVEGLDIPSLFTNRATLGRWLGGPGTQTVIEAIAANGDERWLPWLEQMAHGGRLEPTLALAAALACGTEIPTWGATYLPRLLSQSPWLFRFTSGRGANTQLALWLSRNYPQSPNTPFGGWWQSNRVLVSCGNDTVFEELLLRFPSMTDRAQELLGMAIPELGDIWVARFQRVAFASPGAQHHHRLAETLSLEIDDKTAREWIARGYYHAGWRVLVARHGTEVLPELIAELPASFGGQLRLPALEAMALLGDSPATLLDALNLRLFNELSQQLGIRPKVGESLILVAATVKPLGIAWLIGQCLRNPKVFGGYHAKLVLEVYVNWTKEAGRTLTLDPEMGQMSFERWYASIQFVTNWDNYNSPEALRLVPDVAVEAVLGPFSNDDERAEKILERLPALPAYHEALFERMFKSTRLVPLIPKIFADALNSFPQNQMLRLVQSEHMKDDELFHRLSVATDLSFRETHFLLAKRVVSAPLNLHNIRFVANMLRSYPREVLVSFFQPMLSQDGVAESDSLHWLLREAGNARRELLIDEHGKLLH